MIQLFNDDCMKIIETLDDKSIDLVVTDPPYNFGAKGGGFYAENQGVLQRKYAQKLQDLDCCDFEPIPFLNKLKSKMKAIYMYIFCNKILVADYITWAKENNCNYDILVMCKSNPIPAYNNHYMSDLEYIIIIREPGTYFSNEKNIELYRKWYLTQCKQGIHPAEKPIELIKRFIKVGSKEGDVIFDGFMGSGTTGVAAKMLKRDFIGCEIDKHYFDVCNSRINGILIKEENCIQGELFYGKNSII